MAKGKRKASPKQIAALAKARKALKAKYGTSNIGEINKRKKGGKKAAAAAPAPAAPKKKRRRKKASKKAAAPKRRRKKAATKKAAPKRRRKRSSKKAHRAAAPKRRRRRGGRKARHTVGGKVHVVKMPVAARVKVIRIEEAKRRRRRRKKSAALLENPSYDLALAELEENPLSYSALFENPAGPYSMGSLKAFGWAAGGVGIGLVLAELADRYVATRAPSDSKSGAKGAHPWYGRDAVAAIQRRPDAMRLGVQAAGALAGIGGAYIAGRRGGRILPWMLGGTAVGFGANLAKQLLVWFVLPRVLKIKEGEEGKPSLANRLAALEQVSLQDKIDALWEQWDQVGALNAGQQPTPVIASPLNEDTTKDLLTLGGATGNSPLPVAGRQQPTWVGQPGMVGTCMSCGGMQGHWSTCPESCPDCPGGSGITDDSSTTSSGDGGRDGGGEPHYCEYTVQRGDDLEALLAATGLTMNDVAALNGGGLPSTFWVAGNSVTLPAALCMEIVRRRQPSEPRIPPPTRPEFPRQPPTYKGPPGETFTRANLPSDPGVKLTRANIPGSYVPPTVKGAEEPASRHAALRGVGGEDTEHD